MSIRRQGELVDANRNRLESPVDNSEPWELELCRLIDEIHMLAPAFGLRKIRDLLRVEYCKQTTRVAGLFSNEKSVLRLVTATLMETYEEWETGKYSLNLTPQN